MIPRGEFTKTATDTQIREWGLSKPHAVKVLIKRDGRVFVFGQKPRFEGLGSGRRFGWYLLGHRDSIAEMLPLRAIDGDPVATRILSTTKDMPA